MSEFASQMIPDLVYASLPWRRLCIMYLLFQDIRAQPTWRFEHVHSVPVQLQRGQVHAQRHPWLLRLCFEPLPLRKSWGSARLRGRGERYAGGFLRLVAWSMAVGLGLGLGKGEIVRLVCRVIVTSPLLAPAVNAARPL